MGLALLFSFGFDFFVLSVVLVFFSFSSSLLWSADIVWLTVWTAARFLNDNNLCNTNFMWVCAIDWKRVHAWDRRGLFVCLFVFFTRNLIWLDNNCENCLQKCKMNVCYCPLFDWIQKGTISLEYALFETKRPCKHQFSKTIFSIEQFTFYSDRAFTSGNNPEKRLPSFLSHSVNVKSFLQPSTLSFCIVFLFIY